MKDLLRIHECVMQKQYEMILQFVKLTFVVVLNFGRPLTSQSAKCIFLNNKDV